MFILAVSLEINAKLIILKHVDEIIRRDSNMVKNNNKENVLLNSKNSIYLPKKWSLFWLFVEAITDNKGTTDATEKDSRIPLIINKTSKK